MTMQVNIRYEIKGTVPDAEAKQAPELLEVSINHYCTWSVCLSVYLSVCVSTTILALQATRRLMSNTNSFSAIRARKIMWRFC